jgi:ribosomal-protein-alanine N-acetyltransferase
MRIELHDGFHLSPVRDGDQAAYVEHFSDKDTTDRLLAIPYPYTAEDAEDWVRLHVDAACKEPRPSHFALRRADGFLIGGIGLQLNSGAARHRAELGYWIAKDYRGRGLTTAAVRALARYAFQDLGLRRIEATSFSHNLASHRVLEKAGFTREGFLAAYHIKDGILIDAYMFAIVASVTTSPS